MEGENSVDIYADLLQDNSPTEIQEPEPLEKVSASACSGAEAVVGCVDESSRLTTLDLYDDLITDENVQHQVSHQELSEKYQRALNTISDLERQLQTSRNHESFYMEKSQTLEKNISLLYVTAKAELQRKDTQIGQLREDLNFRNLSYKPSCPKFPRKDFFSGEGHARSNGHSRSVGTTERDNQSEKESYMSPRKRKIVSSWDDLKENFKRQKRDEPRHVAQDASSSKGLHIYSEKSRDGLISARKLVEKSIKDLRNRRSNEYKKSLKEHSESVIEGDLPVGSPCKVISKPEPTALQCNENRGGLEKVNNTETTKSELSFKGLIDSHTEVEKSQNDKLSSEQVRLTSETNSSCDVGGHSISRDKPIERSPCRSRREINRSEKDKHRTYSEKKKSSNSERSSHRRRKVEEKEKAATNRTKVSSKSADSSRRRTPEHRRMLERSRRNSKNVKEDEPKRDTERRASSDDLRFKLQQKKRLRSKERRQEKISESEKEIPAEEKDTKNTKRYKLPRTESDQKDKLLERGKSGSQKAEKLKVQEKPQDSSDIEKVWSLVNSESSKYVEKSPSSNNIQNVSDTKESESTECKEERFLETSWNKKKTLSPKPSSRPVDKVTFPEITNVEEAMIRVNEEKISMYSKASNKEVETLSNKTLGAFDKETFQAGKEDAAEHLSLNKTQGENNPDKKICASSDKSDFKSPPRKQDNECCVADSRDAANVFIEELISIDQRNENFFSGEKDHELGFTPSKSVSPGHQTENECKAEECYKVTPDVHENSLSCFDIKIHVSETELNDLLGNEDSLSGGIASTQPSHQKKETVKDLKKVSSRSQSKYSSCMDSSRNKKEKSSTIAKEGSQSLSKRIEPERPKAVLKLPLGPKQVFTESIIFENTEKPKTLSEKVYTSSKGTKIVMKSEALKSEEKKPVTKNSLSKKEYDADREFLNQLKTKYSKEQSKISQKSKDVLVSNQSDSVELSKTCMKQKDDLKVNEVYTGSEVKEKSGFLEISSECVLKNTKEPGNSAGKIDNPCTFELQGQDLTQNLNKGEEEGKTTQDEEKISDIEVDNSVEEEKVAKEQKWDISETFLGEKSRSLKVNDLGDISEENCDAKESPTTDMSIDEHRETVKEQAVTPENPPVLSSAVSIDFIRNSIMKKIEEKSNLCDDTSAVSKSVSSVAEQVTDNESQEEVAEKTVPVKNSVITNTVELNTGKPCQEEDVQSFLMPSSPNGQKMDSICRDVLTETESITEFFDEESQLDLKGAVSLRARDGINVRRQSFEKQNEDKEAVDNNCAPVEERNFDVVEAFETENVQPSLRDSESEEGEVHSSDGESEDLIHKRKEKGNREAKIRSLSNASDREPGSRKRYSSSHRPKSESKEKQRKDRVEDKSRSSEVERTVKPRTPRRDSERKYDPKQDRKDREYRSKEKSPSSRSSRERKTDERRRENDSKHSASHQHSRTRMEEADRHKSSKTISDRHEKSRHGVTETREDRHSRSRHSSSETKPDRHPRKLHESSDPKSVHRSSSKTAQDSYKSTRRK